jgi:hypothetical protein
MRERAETRPPWWGKRSNPPEPLCEKHEPCPCANPCPAMSQMFLLPPRWNPKQPA